MAELVPSYLPNKASLKLNESFRWCVPEILDAVPSGPHTQKVKVVVARLNDVSLNGRKYVEPELRNLAGSLIGRPVFVNHDPKRVIGDIPYATFEDGAVEALLNINKPMYVDRLRNKDPSHTGWSIGADYFYNRCLECDLRFKDLETLKTHMQKDHGKFNFTLEPRGVIGREISYVEAPEVPGLKTTTQLVETADGFSKLCETVISEHISTVTVQPVTTVSPTVPAAELKLNEPCSPELKACVDTLIMGGQDEASAYAICKARLGETLTLTELSTLMCSAPEPYKSAFDKYLQPLDTMANEWHAKEKQLNETVNLQEKLTKAESSNGVLTETVKSLQTQLETERAKTAQFTQLQETVSKLQEQLTKAENQVARYERYAQLKGFKGHSQPLPQPTEPVVTDPLKQ